MAVYDLPATDFDSPQALTSVLGSFWTQIYEGRGQIEKYAEGVGLLARQAQRDITEYLQTISRETVPLEHVEYWQPMTIAESALQTDPRAAVALGDGRLIGDGLRLGDTKVVSGYAFTLPDAVRNVQMICNRLTSPSITWTRDLDFTVDAAAHLLILAENPFDNPLIPTQPSDTDELEVTLWLSYVTYDWQYLANQVGYALGMQTESSLAAREAVNALSDAIVSGTAKADIERFLAALTGTPLIRGTETVTQIITTDEQLCIVTDAASYQYPAGATATVAVGDTVVAGQSPTTLLQVYELTRRVIPDIPQLTLAVGILPDEVTADLTFYNRTCEWTVSSDIYGLTKMTFPVSGFADDVTWFWDSVHAAGVAAGQTLANLLDRRGNQIGEPTAADLPTTVNPLQFLVDNLLHANLFVAYVHASELNGLPLRWVSKLRRILPPHVALAIVLVLQTLSDSATMTGDDQVTADYGLTPLTDAIDPTYSADDALRPYVVSATCQ